MMNLRAKGFYLDNAEEICALEFREKEEHFKKMKQMKKKQSELLAIIESGDAEEALEAATELQELSH